MTERGKLFVGRGGKVRSLSDEGVFVQRRGEWLWGRVRPTGGAAESEGKKKEHFCPLWGGDEGGDSRLDRENAEKGSYYGGKNNPRVNREKKRIPKVTGETRERAITGGNYFGSRDTR